MNVKIILFFYTLLAGLFFFSCQTTPDPPNVLLLYMDDLRPQLFCYDVQQMETPNIDKLASEGVVFNNAYCNVAVCGASRASMLSGMRPSRARFNRYDTFLGEDAPDAISLPQLFHENGYTTISNGKIYHHLDDRMDDWDQVWRPYAFDENPKGLAPTDWWQTLWRDYQLPENKKIYAESNRGPAFEKADVPDSTYIDGLMTQKVMRDLEKLKKSGEPFFLAAGFISNHLPFNAPARFWEIYPDSMIHQPYNNTVGKNVPKASLFPSAELRQYTDIPPLDERVPDEMAKTLIHGYYATVSYVDFLIGEILSKLKELELDKNTIVVLVSDHGYNLQEHGQWAKWTNHLTSLQVPLIFRVPNSAVKGESDAMIELIDVYPTLAELCGLPVPLKQVEGMSLVPQLQDLSKPGKEYVFATNRNSYTIKTRQYCYTEFMNPENDMIAKTLYDHVNDRDETVNIAEEDEFSAVVNELHHLLYEKFGKNIRGE